MLTSAPPLRRRRRRPRVVWMRFAPLLAIGAVAFAAGATLGGREEHPLRRTAQQFADAWSRGDYGAMYALLTPAARRATPLERFTRTYRHAGELATVSAVQAGRARDPGDATTVGVPVELRTRLFGRLAGDLRLPMVRVGEDGAAVAWRPYLAHPGLRRGEKLARTTRLPPRAALQARDGTVLAEGAERTRGPRADAAASIVGSVGPAPAERAAELTRRGVPAGAEVGIDGLERAFDVELAGTPGGELRAGDRVLASVAPRAGHDVRTSIDLDVQAAAVTALAGRFGGIAVVRPANGEVLGLAGIAYSAPQPPGSVFKIITLAGALQHRVARPSSRYPVARAAVLEGVELENANGEYCGGTLRDSFAHSCNSAFGPIGAKLGARRLVAAAEAFGFNAPPAIEGAQPSTIPPAAEIGDDLAVGSTAIGQGRVLATPLEFAAVAATIANRGLRVEPTLRKGASPRAVRAVPAAVARRVGAYMRAVVTEGTGTAAALPGVRVAGKTGTAELRETQPDPQTGEVPVDDVTDTNAWFAAYAPAGRPRLAVAVMLVGQGAGGATAAPAARVVLESALAG